MILADFGSDGLPHGSPWTFDSHPDVMVVGAILILGYWLALRRLAPKLVPPPRPAVTPRQLWCFGLAMVAYFAFNLWPVHDLAEGYLLSVHMVQHNALTLVFPPLLLLGMPPWLLGWILRPGRIVRFLTRPAVGLVAYVGVSLWSHVPSTANTAIRNGGFHFAVHVALVGSALLLWRVVLRPLPGLLAVRSPLGWPYLLIAQLPLTVPTIAFTHANTILYRAYLPFPEIWGLSDIRDQRLAGGIMTVIELGVAVALIAAFMTSAFREPQKSPDDAHSAPGHPGGERAELTPSHHLLGPRS